MVQFNYNKLKGLIKEKLGTQSKFADELGISRTSLYERLKGNVPFSQNEIHRAKKILNINNQELTAVFFNTFDTENRTNT